MSERLVSHTVYSRITPERLTEISGYRSQDVTVDRFQNPEPDQLDLLWDIAIYHPSPVARHEATFIVGELGLPGWERLMGIVKFDTSIVAKHEAIEALGKIREPFDVLYAYRFLLKITKDRGAGYDEGVGHPDVQITAEEAIQGLEAEIRKLPEFYRQEAEKMKKHYKPNT